MGGAVDLLARDYDEMIATMKGVDFEPFYFLILHKAAPLLQLGHNTLTPQWQAVEATRG